MGDTPDFARDLRPERVEEGRQRVRIPLAYQGAPGRAFGGVSAAIALRAAGLETEQHQPTSLHVHYLRPTRHDVDLDLEVEPLRRGRSADVIQVAGRQDATRVFHAVVVATAGGPALDAPVFAPDDAPSLPDASRLPRMADRIRETWFDLPRDHNIDTSDCRIVDDEAVRQAIASDHEHRFIWAASYGQAQASEDRWVQAAHAAVCADNDSTFHRAGLAAGLGLPFPTADSGLSTLTTLDLNVRFHWSGPVTPWLWSVGEPLAADGHTSAAGCRVWSSDGELIASATLSSLIAAAG